MQEIKTTCLVETEHLFKGIRLQPAYVAVTWSERECACARQRKLITINSYTNSTFNKQEKGKWSLNTTQIFNIHIYIP